MIGSAEKEIFILHLNKIKKKEEKKIKREALKPLLLINRIWQVDINQSIEIPIKYDMGSVESFDIEQRRISNPIGQKILKIA